MPEFTVADGVDLYYEDFGGDGRPVILIHGWPGSSASWDSTVGPLAAAGYRVIAYDRRGFGRSSKPDTGYDYDTLTADLASVMDQLDVSDACLVGFSMGGGEVARYLGTHGSERVSGAVFCAAITPCLEVRDDNPDGAMPLQGFLDLQQACGADRQGFLREFLTGFFSTPRGLKVSDEQVEQALQIAAPAGSVALVETIRLWAEDLRSDVAKIDVPTLVIHGDGDQTVPLAASAARMSDLVPQSTLEVIPDGPHGITVSHADVVNRSLIAFLDAL